MRLWAPFSQNRSQNPEDPAASQLFRCGGLAQPMCPADLGVVGLAGGESDGSERANPKRISELVDFPGWSIFRFQDSPLVSMSFGQVTQLLFSGSDVAK